MALVSVWRRLEIREQGIYYDSCIKWKYITSYNWQDQKDNILQIDYKGTSEKEHTLEIKVSRDEKEKISQILQTKINQSPT